MAPPKISTPQVQVQTTSQINPEAKPKAIIRQPPKAQPLIKQPEQPKLLEQTQKFETIKVAVRVRPLGERELDVSDFETIRVMEQKDVVLINPAFELGIEQDNLKAKGFEQHFSFNWAFDKVTTTKSVFDAACQSSVDQLIQGFNVAIFSYGATGSGKSFTMLNNVDNPGLLIRALNRIFTQVDSSTLNEITALMSYVEIHNEVMKDLLQRQQVELDVREDPVRGIIINNVVEKPVKSTNEVLSLMKFGARTKVDDMTKAHDVLTLTLEIKEKNSGQQQIKSVCKIQLIDLGGSERGTGKGSKINTSLTVLGNCIQSLYEGQEKGMTFVPYRNSKLTRLMKDSLGGNCKTVMIACISPAVTAYEATLQTLQYASNVAHIQNNNRKNIVSQEQPLANYSILIEKLKQENQELKKIVNINQSHIPEVIKAADNQILVSNIENRISIHFQTEKELKQQIYMLEGEYSKVSFRQEQLQEDLERIEGFDKIEADKLRSQLESDQRILKEFKTKMEQQEKEFKIYFNNRNVIYSVKIFFIYKDISSSGLPKLYQSYLNSLMKVGILNVENMEVKQSEQRSILIKQQQDKQLEIMRSQLKLRDDIIHDQKKYISVHAKPTTFSQVKSTQEIIKESKAILVHYPLPESKSHSYYNKQAYAAQKLQLDEFHQTKFNNIRKQLATPKKPSSIFNETQSQYVKGYSSSSPQLPPLKSKLTESRLSDQSKKTKSPAPAAQNLPWVNKNRDRDFSKFEYDWQHGGYHLKQERQTGKTIKPQQYLHRKRYDAQLNNSNISNNSHNSNNSSFSKGMLKK